MLVEIFKAPFNTKGDQMPARLIAIQYHVDDLQMETKMRAAGNALFDCNIHGMSREMISRMHNGHHRTAIFELAE